MYKHIKALILKTVKKAKSVLDAHICMVSIIVPVYNPGPGIKHCIESLQNQTLKDIEILVIDDCSSDNSIELIKQNVAADKRIRVFKNRKNSGPGYSRNKGIQKSRGKYLSFVDPDDYLALDFCEILYKMGEKEKTDIIKGLMLCEKLDGNPMWKNPQANKWLREKLAKGVPLYRAFNRGHQTAIYRTKFIKTNDIKYSLDRRGEDVMFLLMACSKTKSISIVENTFYYYCERETSAVNSMGIKSLSNYFDSFCRIVAYCVNSLPDNEYTRDYLLELFLAGIKEIYRYVDIPELRNNLPAFMAILRAELQKVPTHDEWIKDVYPLQVIEKFDYVLPKQPFTSAWEGFNPPVRYARLLKHWIDFYVDNPEERLAMNKDLDNLIATAKDAVDTKKNSTFSVKEKEEGKAIFEEQLKRINHMK